MSSHLQRYTSVHFKWRYSITPGQEPPGLMVKVVVKHCPLCWQFHRLHFFGPPLTELYTIIIDLDSGQRQN